MPTVSVTNSTAVTGNPASMQLVVPAGTPSDGVVTIAMTFQGKSPGLNNTITGRVINHNRQLLELFTPADSGLGANANQVTLTRTLTGITDDVGDTWTVSIQSSGIFLQPTDGSPPDGITLQSVTISYDVPGPPPLSLTLAINPTSIAPDGTATATLTRSGGGEIAGQVTYTEGFETSLGGWVGSGHSAFRQTSPGRSRSGSACVELHGDGNNEESQMTLVRTEATPSTMRFWHRFLSGSPSNYAFGMRVNGQIAWTNTVASQPYAEATVQVPAGTNTYQFFVTPPGFTRVSRTNIDDITITSPPINTATDALPITLTSGTPAAATVPSSVTIPEDQTSETFTVTGVAVGQSEILATYEGTNPDATATATITVAVPTTVTIQITGVPTGCVVYAALIGTPNVPDSEPIRRHAVVESDNGTATFVLPLLANLNSGTPQYSASRWRITRVIPGTGVQVGHPFVVDAADGNQTIATGGA